VHLYWHLVHRFRQAHQLRGISHRFVSTSKAANAYANSSAFSKKLHAAYPSDIAIKVILDNEPTHVSEETKKWLAARSLGYARM